jgi:CRISPR-associated protein (TIGR03986 family)
MSNDKILDLPKHVNPTRADRTASAPYNFIPLPEVVVTAADDAEKLPNHNTYANADYPNTGHFEVTLTTKSPLYVRCPFTRDEFDLDEQDKDRNGQPLGNQTPYTARIKNTPEFFYTHVRNQPVIPGSSLRGMLRSVLEIVGYGKMQSVTDAPKMFFRAVAAPREDPLKGPYEEVLGRNGRHVRVGYLNKRHDGWYIQPAKTPKDMGWRETKPYFPVKDKVFDQLKLPELIRFKGPEYHPQYLRVSFDVQTLRNKNGEQFEVITAINAATEKHTHRGVLVASGNMHETESQESESPRTTYALVLEKIEESIKINDHAVKDYLDAATPFQKQKPPFDPLMGCLLNQGIVFYVPPSKGGEVLYFGHTPNFRIPALVEQQNVKRAATPGDFVPHDLRRPEDLDYAEALFGFVRTDKELENMKTCGVIQNIPRQGDKQRAYASRVFVTDATLNESQTDLWFDDPIVTPKILASPKPTAFQHYLTQQEPNKRDRLDHYDSPPPHETVIRGHKRYWHQNLGTEDRQSLEDIRRMIEEERETLQKIADDERKGKGDTQHTQFKPVKPEVKFTFRVYFENLSDRELGVLCWTLHPLASKTYCHSLGMGKPLGMGAVTLDATLYLTGRRKRYSVLFDGDNWQTGVTGVGEKLSDRAVLERLTQKFELDVLDVLKPNKPCAHLSDLKRIGMLLKMMEWPGLSQSDVATLALPEFRQRKVLPDPSASLFGGLSGDAVPTVANEPSLIPTSLNDVSNSPQEKKPPPGGKTGGTPKTAVPRSGELVRCILLEEKTKRGGWKAQLKVGNGQGAILAGNEPLDLASGQEADLIVQSTDPKNMSFRWPKKNK